MNSWLILVFFSNSFLNAASFSGEDDETTISFEKMSLKGVTFNLEEEDVPKAFSRVISTDSIYSCSHCSSPSSSSEITSDPPTSPRPSLKKAAATIETSQADLILAFSDALCKNEIQEANVLLPLILDWKMTYPHSNFSALSSLSKSAAKKHFLGKLLKADYVEIFGPLLKGDNKNLAGGYILALSLFDPSIQRQIMAHLIRRAPSLHDFLLQASIYFKLHVTVVEFILSSRQGANIQFADNSVSLRGLPQGVSITSSEQIPVNPSFFMNFDDSVHAFHRWEVNYNNSSEINFLLGMIENIPEPVGVLRVAFENYPSRIVQALIDICPLRQMANFHLAYLITKHPKMRSKYPSIATLVDSEILFDRMRNGDAIIVALALLSYQEPSVQISIMTDFLMSGEKRSTPPLRHFKYRTSSANLTEEFKTETGLYDLPVSSAEIFLLTACKWDIDDAAFSILYEACLKIRTKEMNVAKASALDWAIRNSLTKKIEILNF